MTDIEDLISSIDKYNDITMLYYKNYLKYPNKNFNFLRTKTLKNSVIQYNLNKIILRKSFLNLVEKNILNMDEIFLKTLITKPNKSESGIMSVSILTSPYPSWKDDDGNEKSQEFSCKHDC